MAAHVVDAFVDANATMKAWVNSLDDVVGPGSDLPLGAHLKHLRSPGRGAYALVSTVDSDDMFANEGPSHRALMSASVFGFTEDEANRAARAYANALRRIPYLLPVVTLPSGATVRILAVANIHGPNVVLASSEGVQYLVDATVVFAAV